MPRNITATVSISGSPSQQVTVLIPNSADADLNQRMAYIADSIKNTVFQAAKVNSITYDDPVAVGLKFGLLPTAVLTGFANLNFPSVAAGGNQSLTIAVPGAQAQDRPILFPRYGSAPPALLFVPSILASDVVTVTAFNFTAGAIDPPSILFEVFIIRLGA